jgi:hypothetical protein
VFDFSNTPKSLRDHFVLRIFNRLPRRLRKRIIKSDICSIYNN